MSEEKNTFSAKILKRFMTTEEFQTLTDRYNGARKARGRTGRVGVFKPPTELQYEIAMFTKENSYPAAVQKFGISYNKVLGAVRKVSMYTFMTGASNVT